MANSDTTLCTGPCVGELLLDSQVKDAVFTGRTPNGKPIVRVEGCLDDIIVNPVAYSSSNLGAFNEACAYAARKDLSEIPLSERTCQIELRNVEDDGNDGLIGTANLLVSREYEKDRRRFKRSICSVLGALLVGFDPESLNPIMALPETDIPTIVVPKAEPACINDGYAHFLKKVRENYIGKISIENRDERHFKIYLFGYKGSKNSVSVGLAHFVPDNRFDSSVSYNPLKSLLWCSLNTVLRGDVGNCSLVTTDGYPEYPIIVLPPLHASEAQGDWEFGSANRHEYYRDRRFFNNVRSTYFRNLSLGRFCFGMSRIFMLSFVLGEKIIIYINDMILGCLW